MPKKNTEDFDIYKGYRSGQYRHFRMVDSGKRETVIRKGRPIIRKVLEKAEIPFEEIKKINLDNIGVIMPTPSSGHYTQLQNYLIDYWVGVIGSGAYTVYTKLLRHCYGDKNFCYVDIEIMCKQLGMTRPTFNNHIDKLEMHGFIIKFWREDKENNNRESSPFFLVRKTVPKIPEDILNVFFDEDMIAEHDKTLAELSDMTIAGREKVDYLGELIEGKELISEGKSNPNAECVTNQALLETMTERQIGVNNRIHDYLKAVIAKPSYETFLMNTVFVYSEEIGLLTVVCGSDYSYDYISGTEKYSSTIMDVLHKQMFVDARLAFTTITKYLNKKGEA